MQYYGWSLANRARLLPTGEQLEYCVSTLKNAAELFRGRTRVVFVVPHYDAKILNPAWVGGDVSSRSYRQTEMRFRVTLLWLSLAYSLIT